MNHQVYLETNTGISIMSETQMLIKEWKELIEEKRNDAFESLELMDINERLSDALLDTIKELEGDFD
jgi:hypothetical protein